MSIETDIRGVQAKLGLTVDGFAGPITWAAIHRAIVGDTPPVSEDATGIDPRSEKAIMTLLPEVRPLARLLIVSAAKRSITVKVTSALRTYEEQNDLYEQGRSKPGNVVTLARGGYSSHNFGTAFDITIFADGKPVWESPLYSVVGELGEAIGLSWGGRWNSPDEPHFYLKPHWAQDMSESQMMAGLRARKESGQSAFA